MHEMWLCKEIIAIIEEKNVKLAYKKIKIINICIGDLLSFEKSVLLFNFKVVAQGSIAEHADLNIITIQGLADCNCCGTSFIIKKYYDFCPKCGRADFFIKQGEEFVIKSMEVI